MGVPLQGALQALTRFGVYTGALLSFLTTLQAFEQDQKCYMIVTICTTYESMGWNFKWL